MQAQVQESPLRILLGLLEQPFCKANEFVELQQGDKNYLNLCPVILDIQFLFSCWGLARFIKIHFPPFFHLYLYDLFIYEVSALCGSVGDVVSGKEVCKRMSFDGSLGYVLDIVLVEQYRPFKKRSFRVSWLRCIWGDPSLRLLCWIMLLVAPQFLYDEYRCQAHVLNWRILLL